MAERCKKNMNNVLLLVGFGCFLYFSETSRALATAGIILLSAGMIAQMILELKKIGAKAK